MSDSPNGSPSSNSFLTGGPAISSGGAPLGLSIPLATQPTPIPGQTFRTIPSPVFQPALFGLVIKSSLGGLTVNGYTFPLSPESVRKEYCVDLTSKILTVDLKWVEAQHLTINDEIIAFPEELDGTQVLQRSKVQQVGMVFAEKFKVITTKGTTIVSSNHGFVAYHDDKRAFPTRKRYSWKKAKELQIGDAIKFAYTPWEVGASREDGWLAGLLDGEGWVSKKGHTVGVAQKEGAVLDKARQLFIQHNIQFREQLSGDGKCMQLLTKGAWPALHLLGITRPLRLLPDSKYLWEGCQAFRHRSGGMSWEAGTYKVDPEAQHVAMVIAIEPMGIGPVIALQTSTKTLIADGFLGHNTAMSQIYDVAGSPITGGVYREVDSYGVSPVTYVIEGTTGWQQHSTDGYQYTGLQSIQALEGLLYQYAQMNAAIAGTGLPPFFLEFYDYFREDFWQVEPVGQQGTRMSRTRPLLVSYSFRLVGINNVSNPIVAALDEVALAFGINPLLAIGSLGAVASSITSNYGGVTASISQGLSSVGL